MRWKYLLAFAALFAAGCSDNPTKPKDQPALTPNDTPSHAVQRFIESYERKQATDFTAMFTQDFVFEFSNSTDPDLVAKYPTGWYKTDESESALHLFAGLAPLPAASSIDLQFANTIPVDDNTSSDPVTHKILSTHVDGSIVVPPSGGATESTTYLIMDNEEFHIVRGDAAAGLVAGQVADTAHWYVERWVDRTNQPSQRMSPSTEAETWARLRSLYRSDTNPTLAHNSTPQGAITRLVAAYERRLHDEYTGLFTGDFTYEFSNSTDPDLAAIYAAGWFKADENESSEHLFQGYTPPGGATLPAASSIDINLFVTLPSDDNGSADPVTHKVLFTRVDGSFVFPGETEPTTFLLSNNQNAFYLVRGDVATGLDSSQPADDEHWYVYKWVDLTQSSFVTTAHNSRLTATMTWGKMKGLYR